jgi:hypothetical protein
MLNALQKSDIDAVIEACGHDGSVGDAAVTSLETERGRVYAVVERLSREAQEELMALMWTGGPKNHSTFQENLDLARKTRDENHASHLAEQHARLPLYLRDGLKRLPTED